MKRIVYILLFSLTIIIPGTLLAQGAGGNTYDFLNITSSARVGALGGNQVGMGLNDVNMVYHNPANLNENLHQAITFNYVPYVADIKVTYAGYAHHINNIGTFGLSIHSVNYGSFDRADVNGNLNGTFSAAEYAINMSYSKKLSQQLTAGVSLKPVISSLEQYNSFGIAADVGMMYRSRDTLFTAGIVLKNYGSQITAYNDTYEPMPTDLQIGISKRLAHAPFRFSVTSQHLFDWDIKYDVRDGNDVKVDGEGNNGSAFDQIMRHMVLGVEILPSDNFYIAVGYNHRRRKELGVAEKMSTVGYSWGIGFRVYKFHFAYGSARYHLAGSSNHFSISTRISDFTR